MRFRSQVPALLSRCFQERFHLAGWEVHVGRVLMAWYLWKALPYHAPGYTGQPHPEALGQWFDFTWISHPGPFSAALIGAKAGLVLYAMGLAAPFGLAAFLLLDLSMNTLMSSQGIHGHGASLNALLALALLTGHLCHMARHWSWRSLIFSGADSGQAALGAGRCMLAATYVVAGMSKLFYGGWDWWMRGECFVIQMCKAQDEMVSTWVNPPLTEGARAMARFLEAHPAAAMPMLAAALLMELGAFLACTTRLRALLLGLGLAAFHHMNDWLMGLPFPGNTQALMVLYIMPLSWVVRLAGGLWPRMPIKVPETPPPSNDRPLRLLLLQTPALSILFAGFLLWRGDWYPFSNFPMYSILPPGTHSLYATDMEDRIIPFMKLGIDAPTLKKMINVELRKFKSDGTVMRMSQLKDEHWQAAAASVINRIRTTWKDPGLRETSFKLHVKYYEAGPSKVTITETSIGSFPAAPPDAGPKP